MSIRGMRFAQKARPQNSGQKLVLMLLCDFHQERDDLCIPSVALIADQAVMTVRSVRRILGELERQGWIRRHRRTGHTTVYELIWDMVEESDRHFRPAPIDAPSTAPDPAPERDADPGQIVTPPGAESGPCDTGDPGQIVRGTPDKLSPRTNCHPGHQCPGGGDTSVRGGVTPVSPTQVLTGIQQGETRAGAREAPPPPDDVRSPFAEGMAIVEGVMQAYADAFRGTAAVLPKTATTGTIQALAMRASDLRRSGIEPDLSYWHRLFAHLAKSDFLTGRKLQSSGNPFRLRLDWLLREEEFHRARSHAYCDAGACPHVPACQAVRP